MFHFYNTFLNSLNIASLFTGGISIFSAFLGFSSFTCFSFTILSAILFPIHLTVASAALWTTFLETVFKHLVLYPIINFYIFSLMTKNPYPLTYIFVLGSVEYRITSIY